MSWGDGGNEVVLNTKWLDSGYIFEGNANRISEWIGIICESKEP